MLPEKPKIIFFLGGLLSFCLEIVARLLFPSSIPWLYDLLHLLTYWNIML
jgi:TRAP-type C4-dicarboxylate transport system permease small subunit